MHSRLSLCRAYTCTPVPPYELPATGLNRPGFERSPLSMLAFLAARVNLSLPGTQ